MARARLARAVRAGHGTLTLTLTLTRPLTLTPTLTLTLTQPLPLTLMAATSQEGRRANVRDGFSAWCLARAAAHA